MGSTAHEADRHKPGIWQEIFQVYIIRCIQQTLAGSQEMLKRLMLRGASPFTRLSNFD